jgi:hypothetical protein
VRGEGWKWVKILPAAQYPDLTKFGRIHPVHVPATPEIRSEIEVLEAEQDKSIKRIKRLRNTRQTWMRECPKLRCGSTS